MKTYTTKELRKLEFKARNGDDESLEQLRAINNNLAKRTNVQLARLERAGYTKYAYDLATTYTKSAYGNNRFKMNTLSNPIDLRKQITQMQKFWEKETATLAGQKRVEKKRIEVFLDRFDVEIIPNKKAKPKIDGRTGMTRRQVREFLDFLGEEPLRQLVKSQGKIGSGDIVDLIRGDITQRSEAKNEIRLLMEQYQRGEAGMLNNDEERIYYDDIIKYLKNPSIYNRLVGKK